MKRIRLVTALPFVLGIFIGTMITSFLMLAVQSIDEDMPSKGGVASVELLEVPEGAPSQVEEPQEEAEAEAEPFSPSQVVSYNILTSRGSLKEQGFAIHRTWGGEKTVQESISYYVHPGAGKEEVDFANSRKMAIVSLEMEQDTEMQGAERDNQGAFQLWKNVCTKKLGLYLWFVKARDNTYLRTNRLGKLLTLLNSSEPLFVGNPIVPSGKQREDLGLREGESYCHEGCYALSWKALQLLCSKLDSCQENVRSTNEDVEVARCIKEHLGVNCTAATEVCKAR